MRKRKVLYVTFYLYKWFKILLGTSSINEKDIEILPVIWTGRFSEWFSSVQFSSVTQSCLTLCDPMNCSTPGLPFHHQFPKFTQTHVHPVGDAISSSVVPFSSCPQSLPASGSFPMSQLFSWGGQSIGVSASASILPTNTHYWSPLGWTGWISLQSKGLIKYDNFVGCKVVTDKAIIIPSLRESKQGRNLGSWNGVKPMHGGAWWATVHGVAKSQTGPNDFTFTFKTPKLIIRPLEDEWLF